MKYLILAVLLLSTVAYAEDDIPMSAPQPPSTAPNPIAPAATPAQPTLWAIMDLDKRDLNDINGWAQSCPKSVADPLIALLNQKIKALK